MHIHVCKNVSTYIYIYIYICTYEPDSAWRTVGPCSGSLSDSREVCFDLRAHVTFLNHASSLVPGPQKYVKRYPFGLLQRFWAIILYAPEVQTGSNGKSAAIPRPKIEDRDFDW